MGRFVLFIVALLPERAAASSNAVSTSFALRESWYSFRNPEDLIGDDGFQWKEVEESSDYYTLTNPQYYYYYYHDVLDDYRGGGDQFYYYYNELADPVARKQMHLIAGGQVVPGFECHSANLDKVFIDPVFIDTRHLEISVVYYYASWWDTASNFADTGDYYYEETFDYDYYEYYYANQDEQAGTSAIDVWLKSVVATDVADNLKRLPSTGQWRAPSPSNYLQVKPIPHAEQMHAEGRQVETGLGFEYECFGTGQTLVQVELTVKTGTSEKQDICVNWIKQCSTALPNIWIKDDELEDVVVDNKVQWGAPFFKRPPDMYSVFYVSLIQDGTIRLRVPDIYSGKMNIGEVDVRIEDEENQWLDVSQARTRISISYTCHQQGKFPVHMLLQRDWSSYTQILGVHWNKTCAGAGGDEDPFESVEASVLSATWENKTSVVWKGAALPGFKRPCPRAGVARTRRKDDQHTAAEYRPPPKTCFNEVPQLIVPRTDAITVLEWTWDLTENPQFEDSIVGYNPRLMEAKISNDWNNKKSKVSYVCFANGLGNVTVTVYLTGHPPLDIGWRKMCTEPKSPHTGKALTATVAFSLIAVVFSLCGICVVGICYFCRKVSDKATATDTEIASIVGMGREEVTFND